MYVGCVGKRDSSSDDLTFLERIGEYLARCGGVVVTGGAPGADQAFTRGTVRAGGTMELIGQVESRVA